MTILAPSTDCFYLAAWRRMLEEFVREAPDWLLHAEKRAAIERAVVQAEGIISDLRRAEK